MELKAEAMALSDREKALLTRAREYIATGRLPSGVPKSLRAKRGTGESVQPVVLGLLARLGGVVTPGLVLCGIGMAGIAIAAYNRRG